MDNPKAAPPSDAVTGWRIFRSDRGRYWGSREQAYDEAGEQAGCWRTVDADDLSTLCTQIALQESAALMASVE